MPAYDHRLECPHCGYTFSPDYAPIEWQIVKAVDKLGRHSGVATSQAIALEVSLSKSQAVRYLGKLEKRGAVRRVGQRKGWRRAA